MKYFKEITDWGSATAQNHTYYLNDDKTKMVGYIKQGTTDLFKFKRPIRIDLRGRKFIELKDKKTESDSVYFGVKEQPKTNVITVKGSNGKEYFIEKVGNRYTCTCPGFTFRGKCKHVEQY
jgi:queuine/archaeosine tRNA-ribosyltransferase